MNLEQVAHFVSHPHELTLQDAEALRSLTTKYPFSSVYPLLYLTALSNGKSPDLDLALQQHAFKLSDRTKLYYLLTERVNELTSSGVDETKNSKTTEIIEVSVPEDKIIETSTETTEVYVEEAETVQEEAITEAEAAIEAKMESESLDFDQLTEAFTLEQHFEVGDVAVDELRVDELKVDELESSEVEVGLQSPVGQSSVEESSVEEISSLPSTVVRSPVEEPVTEDRKSFTSWLKSGQQQHVQAVPREENLPAGQMEQKKMQASDLIDKFIEEEPSITRSKTDFYSPSKKAKESLDEDAVPVSETLAKIYAAQGNYPKAIHVYHQLMLSVPEKKALFALQIDELKKKITP